MPRQEAERISDAVKEAALDAIQDGKEMLEMVTCGSFRRGRAFCGDVDVLITRKDNKSIRGTVGPIVELLKERGIVTDTLSNQRLSVHSTETFMGICRLPEEGSKHRRLDIKAYPREQYGFAVLYFTGSPHFNRSMRLFAHKKGFSLSDHGLTPTIRVRN